MKLRKSLTDRQKYSVLSFFLPFIAYVLVMICRQYVPFGSSSILYSDMWHQYYPFFVEFRDTLRSGDSLLCNWDMGLGLDYLGLISYYLASPLNLLSVLIPESMLLSYFSLLVPIKLGLAGLFFGIFLEQVFDRRDWSVPLFSSAYALCAWALGYQWNIMWLDTFALLPLVILGLISLLKKRKFLLYTVSLFFAIVCNYYVGFFVCIFVALCFFFYQICYCGGFRRFWADLGLVAGFSLLAIAMTAFIEWPTLMALGDTYSSVNKFPTSFDLNITSDDSILGLLDAMRQVAGNTLGGLEITFKEGLPNLYCGVLPLILVFQFFMNRKFKLREKICSALLFLFFILSFIIRQLDYIWHGFHFTNMIPYRFSFLFSFVVLVLAYRAYLELENTPKWHSVFAGILVIGLIVCSDSRTEPVFLVYNLVFLSIFLFLMLSRSKAVKVDSNAEEAATDHEEVEDLISLEERRQRKNRSLISLLLCAMCLELVCNTVNFGVRFGGTGISNYPRGTTDTDKVIAHMQQLESDSVYYRAETDHTQTLNDDALNGYSGITLFSSSANVRVTKFMSALGYGAKPSYNRYSYEEASAVSNLFLNLKYLISRDGNLMEDETFTHIYNMGKIDLLENNAYLPLGFMTDEGITQISVEDASAGSFAFQNNLFSAATGLQESVYTEITEYNATSDDGITVKQRGMHGAYSYSTGTNTGSVTVSFTVPKDSLVCLDFYVTKRNGITVYKNGVSLYTESLNLDQMLSVGNCTAGDLIEVEFACTKTGEEGRITLNAAMLNSACFWNGYDILRKSTLNLDTLSGATVKGTVTATETAPILYTSIPYNKNWTATVDGEVAEIIVLCDTMVGVYLEPGEHIVSFSYKNTAFHQGLMISVIALIVFGMITVLVYAPIKSGKFEKRSSRKKS